MISIPSFPHFVGLLRHPSFREYVEEVTALERQSGSCEDDDRSYEPTTKSRSVSPSPPLNKEEEASSPPEWEDDQDEQEQARLAGQSF